MWSEGPQQKNVQERGSEFVFVKGRRISSVKSIERRSDKLVHVSMVVTRYAF